MFRECLADAVKPLHAAGLRNCQIVKELGCSRSALGQNLKRLGLVPNGNAHNQHRKKAYDDLTCPVCLRTMKSFNFGRARKRCKQCYHTNRKTNSDITNMLLERVSRLRCWCRRKTLPFDLTTDGIIGMLGKQNGLCFYTDIPIIGSNITIDRIIPSSGYVLNNVVLCTRRSNVMKSDATLDEMEKWMPDWHRRIVNEQMVRSGRTNDSE